MMLDKKESANMKKYNEEKFNNNDYLTKLNMSDAPREVRMQWLCKIIDNEMAKNIDEIDMELVNECQEELAELLTEVREKRTEGQAVKASAESEHAGNLVSRGRTHAKGHTACYVKKRIRLAALIAAVVILASFAGISVVANNHGYNSAFEYVSAMAKELFNMNDGEIIENGNITIIKNGEYTNYTSVEQMVREEKLDIMYPDKLPDGLEIDKVMMVDLVDNKARVSFIFNNENISILINNYYSTNQEYLKKNNHSIIETTYGIFYVIKKNITYQGICYGEKYEYIIFANDYDHLVSLINSLGGKNS